MTNPGDSKTFVFDHKDALNPVYIANQHRLHQFTRKQHWKQPEYTLKPGIGNWESIVQIDGTTRGEGKGISKQQAQEAAAKAALTTLQQPTV
ncbi:hypothetical protein AX14_010057 [Amanita brunnescens Koide BX004]|nr:hypothetical protein AX14_010057 [Amanita brunnescens Koide BX004]